MRNAADIVPNWTGASKAEEPLADAIDAILPQTQCTRCGYEACRPYAQAIARGDAALNRCPPGGSAGIRALAELTGLPPLPLDPACGVEQPRRLAVVDEARCIGCTICIQKCPVDAIVGAPKQMHTVIASLCTGCELCVAPCPVDCIDLVAASDADSDWTAAQREASRSRFERRNARLAREAVRRLSHRDDAAVASTGDAPADRLAVVRAAVGRARARRAARKAAARGTGEPGDFAERAG
ncbi:MAG: RnfABCDGE type electron transport complex subunit B [Burkholderiales bacterium]|jgi:electron transport complex protein RnfB|nr:RnfABCDGE type electron transport complex subunit B [Burkholderiales bacterium]